MSNDWRGGVMESTDEVTRKTLEQFNAKCIRPTMNVMAKKIIKAKKKLKKLQKRQRKQDKQGVLNDKAVGIEPKPKMTMEEYIKWRSNEK